MKTSCLILLAIIGVKIYPQDILTIGEVFDFNIGDEFHIKSNLQSQPPNALRLKVIEKSYSQDNDTVFYKIARNNYTSTFYNEPEPHIEYSFTKDTVENYYTKLDSSIFTFYSHLHYDTIAKNYDSYFTYDSILENSEDFCDLLVNGYECGLGDFEPNIYKYKFGKGIGLIGEFFMEGMSGGNPTIDNSLFYYKKHNGACGTPDNTTSIQKNDLTDIIKIYPNPVDDILNIELTNNEKVIFRLFDSNGKLHVEKLIENNDNINVSRLAEGLYFLNFQLKNGQINRKIIIQ
jgi:hypothetical protein